MPAQHSVLGFKETRTRSHSTKWANMTKTIRKSLFFLFAMAVVAACTAAVVLHITRPTPPDLNAPGVWMLVKATRIGVYHVSVYTFEHQSTTWDPYDVEQNKIVVETGGVRREFRWPYNEEYAAGWCELIDGNDGSIAFVLLGSETSVRVVRFAKGEFVFRPRTDELLSDRELEYERPLDGTLRFIMREINYTSRSGEHTLSKAWEWTPTNGFAEAGRHP